MLFVRKVADVQHKRAARQAIADPVEQILAATVADDGLRERDVRAGVDPVGYRDLDGLALATFDPHGVAVVDAAEVGVVIGVARDADDVERLPRAGFTSEAKGADEVVCVEGFGTGLLGHG